MKTLYESLLDDFDGIDKSFDPKQIVKDWIKNNFVVDGLEISDNPNRHGKYEVSAKCVGCAGRYKSDNITSLTNGLFVWKEISKFFNCSFCPSLTSLEGAPEEVGGYFDCSFCPSLISLEGAPEKVGGGFYCKNCNSLTSLKGAPKEVGGHFYCNDCDSLTSLKGAPKKVDGDFICRGCTSLKSAYLPPTTKIKGEIFE